MLALHAGDVLSVWSSFAWGRVYSATLHLAPVLHVDAQALW